jgi:hypothetical protein
MAKSQIQTEFATTPVSNISQILIYKHHSFKKKGIQTWNTMTKVDPKNLFKISTFLNLF